MIITSDYGSFPHSLLSTSKFNNSHQRTGSQTFALLGQDFRAIVICGVIQVSVETNIFNSEFPGISNYALELQ